jgi:hypothetical protein
VSTGKLRGGRPCIVSPARPERGKLIMGGRAEWIKDLAAWQPFEDKSVTHGLLLSNVLYSGSSPANQKLQEWVMGAVAGAKAAEYPYPGHQFGKRSLPRVLVFTRRQWPQIKRLFSRRRGTAESAYANPPFESRPWSEFPFIPSDIPKYCDGVKKSPWNPHIDKCVAILKRNEGVLLEWARPVRVRPGAEIVTFVGVDQLHGFLRAVALWKFPEGTKVRVICVDIHASELQSAGNWPEGFSFHQLRGSVSELPDILAEGNRISPTEAWIWLDPEAVSVGLNRAATLFSGKQWERADWGAPGSYLLNGCPVLPGESPPSGWPDLEVIYWMGEPATLLRKSFVASLLDAWNARREDCDFERFASRFARDTKADLRLVNLHECGWRMS